ncbi:MAG: complex I subunit 4 family protein, partial [Solirubrobacterales bacterium]
SKVAAYGFLRIAMPLFPDAFADWQMIFLVLALLSILYGSIQAFTQTNVRLILGYSSIAQLGFITLGIFALDPEGRGAQGAILQMVNHGLVVAPLILIIAMLAERAGSEDLEDLGGEAFRAPLLATLFLIVALATLAMPGSANFIGEFYILNALLEAKIVFAFVAGAGVVLAAYYALRLFQRAMHNDKPGTGSRELGLRDGLVLAPLVACIVALAFYPQLILQRTDESATAAVTAVEATNPGSTEEPLARR